MLFSFLMSSILLVAVFGFLLFWILVEPISGCFSLVLLVIIGLIIFLCSLLMGFIGIVPILMIIMLFSIIAAVIRR